MKELFQNALEKKVPEESLEEIQASIEALEIEIEETSTQLTTLQRIERELTFKVMHLEVEHYSAEDLDNLVSELNVTLESLHPTLVIPAIGEYDCYTTEGIGDMLKKGLGAIKKAKDAVAKKFSDAMDKVVRKKVQLFGDTNSKITQAIKDLEGVGEVTFDINEAEYADLALVTDGRKVELVEGKQLKAEVERLSTFVGEYMDKTPVELCINEVVDVMKTYEGDNPSKKYPAPKTLILNAMKKAKMVSKDSAKDKGSENDMNYVTKETAKTSFLLGKEYLASFLSTKSGNIDSVGIGLQYHYMLKEDWKKQGAKAKVPFTISGKDLIDILKRLQSDTASYSTMKALDDKANELNKSVSDVYFAAYDAFAKKVNEAADEYRDGGKVIDGAKIKEIYRRADTFAEAYDFVAEGFMSQSAKRWYFVPFMIPDLAQVILRLSNAAYNASKK